MDSCLRGIVDYLLAQNDAVDRRSGFDRSAMSHVYILDVERDTNLRLRIRLAGTALDHVFRRPLVGHLLEEFIHGPRGADVIASFHHCARTREPIWMRQIVQLKDRAPRFVEGVAVYLVPERIYGGLVVGELGFPGVEAGFERAPLPRPTG